MASKVVSNANGNERIFNVLCEGSGSADIRAKGPVDAVRKALTQLGKVEGAYVIGHGTAQNHTFVVHEKGGTTGNMYYSPFINTKEEQGCDPSALHQNWFARMELIAEQMTCQVFFDRGTRCVYVVQDNGEGIQINEISPSNPKYKNFIH